LEQDLEPEELGTGEKEKRGELTVIGELLRHGLHVFLPVVDMGVDCVVDIGGGNYREVQIKYRENKATFTARFTRPRDNLGNFRMVLTILGAALKTSLDKTGSSTPGSFEVLLNLHQ
jgi:hypothetical protein